jgi:ADP-L-glycero-D-manno-heptose 6-epimerase
MIIVTGGAGFIGSVLVWQLNQLGEKDILVIDQKAKGSPKWQNIKKRTFTDYLESDHFLSELKTGRFDKRSVQAVFHMGACTDTTEMDTAYLTQNNLEYSQHLAEWSLKNKARFLYASSAATYGAGEKGYADTDEVSAHLKPLNPYGVSKQQFDEWVLAKKLQGRMAGFKFFNVFGPNEYHKGAMRSMINKGYEQIKKEGKIRLFKSYRKEYADGEQLRDFVYVKDVVKAMIWFWKHPEKNGIYNLGTGVAKSWNDLANAIFRALDLKPVIEYVPMPENLKGQYQYFTQADLTKLRAAGYDEPFQEFEDSVRDYVLNYLEKSDPYL